MPLGDSVVWGVNGVDQIFYRDGPDGSWEHISGRLKQIEIGELGIFGVNSGDSIYYRVGTRDNIKSTGSTWQW